jgi:hypothetical protein
MSRSLNQKLVSRPRCIQSENRHLITLYPDEKPVIRSDFVLSETRHPTRVYTVAALSSGDAVSSEAAWDTPTRG